MALTFPTVNLNGTSRNSLLEQQLHAMDAIRKAIEAVQDAAPNGRDYTPQGSPQAQAALNAAVCEHVARIDRLNSVLSEIEEIAEHVHAS